MTMHSHQLIGVDYHGVEHTYEQDGHNPRDAAERLKDSKKNIVRILRGDKSRTARNNHYRQLIWNLPGHEMDGNGMNQFAQAMEQARLDTAQMIINQFESKGRTLDVMEEKDSLSVLISGGKPTEEERQEIDEHKDSLIVLLRRRAAAREEREPSDPVESKKKKATLRSTIRGVLPDLPLTFSIADLQQHLRKWEYNDLASDTKVLYNLMNWVVSEGFCARTDKRGQYKLTLPKVFDLQNPDAPPEPQAAPPPAPPPVTPVPVEAPEELVQPPPVNAIPSVPPSPVGFQEALIRLTAELSAAGVSDQQLVGLEQAVDTLETDILSSIEKVVQPIKETIRVLRHSNSVKSQVMRTLAPPSN